MRVSKQQLMLPVAILVLLPLFAFAAVKGYYWYQVRSVVHQLAQQLSLFATVNYERIETGLDGVAGVRGLTITPLGMDQGIRVGAVRVRASSLWELFNLQAEIDKGQLPQKLGFEFSDILIDPSLESWQAFDLPISQAQVDSNLRGCDAAVGLTNSALMSRLGYSQLSFSASMDYRFDSVSKRLHVIAEQSMQDGFDTHFELAVDLGINEFNRANMIFAKPSVGDIRIDYRDLGLHKRSIAFCAKGAGENNEQFVNRHVELEQQALSQLGLTFSEPLVEGYRRYLMAPGQLKLTLLDGQLLSPEDVMLYQPHQLVDLFNPKVWINGAAVEDLSINWQAPELEQGEGEVAQADQQLRQSIESLSKLLQTPFAEPAPEPKPQQDQALTEALQQEPTSYGGIRKFREVPVADLKRFIGHDVRIYTRNDHLVQGRLLAVERNELRLYQEVGHGDANLPIVFKHIERVTVYH